MPIFSRNVSEHSQTTYRQGQLVRQPSPVFKGVPIRGMREPGTDYVTFLVSPGGNFNYQAMGIAG